MGCVIRISRVPVFFSSAKHLMVKAGNKTTKFQVLEKKWLQVRFSHINNVVTSWKNPHKKARA